MQNYIDILALNQDFQEFIFDKKLSRITENCSLLTDFSKIYEKELSKIPFRTNLLNSFNVNENAHSRLLISLLKYKPALCHFLNFLTKKKLNFDISLIDKPILTVEKWRIDGLVQEEGKYAFIIENKIHNAVEQKEQIGRYIDICKQLGYKLKQIYILYLTRYAENKPTIQTWGNYKESDFAERYIKIAYKEDIIIWLEEYLQVISERETIVKSAVIQYIDYLKHVFNSREIFKEMDNKLQDFLVSKLQLTDDNNVKNIDIITTKISEIDELQKHLKALVEITREKCLFEWKNHLHSQEDFKNCNFVVNTDDKYPNIYVVLEYKGKSFAAAIEYYRLNNEIYFGLGRHFSSQTLNEEIKYFFSDFLKDREFQSNDWWYGWKDTTFQEAYTDFSFFLKEVLDKLETQNN
ncbi:PD-(D/E)XK nuclease family protein [Capnocytophaga ochracea]